MMHVDPYLSAKALGVTESEREALIAVLTEMRKDDYNKPSTMLGWENCICGKMRKWRIAKGENSEDVKSYSPALSPLFLNNQLYFGDVKIHESKKEDMIQAAQKFLLGA